MGDRDGEKVRPVQFVSSRVLFYKSPPTHFISALVLYIIPQPCLWFELTFSFQKHISISNYGNENHSKKKKVKMLLFYLHGSTVKYRRLEGTGVMISDEACMQKGVSF